MTTNFDKSMTNEFPKPRNRDGPPETLSNKHSKPEVPLAYLKTVDKENTQPSDKSPSLNAKRKFANKRSHKSPCALPLIVSIKDSLHHKLLQKNCWHHPSDQLHVKPKHAKSAQGKKNPFRKHPFRKKPPSPLCRPTKDWLNHLEFFHLITRDCPRKDQSPSQENLQKGQFQSESRIDLRKPITFLPLVGGHHACKQKG